MSILIKDMEMPKSCSECPMYSRYGSCCLLESNGCVDRYNYDFNLIPDWCPLSEAPKPCEDAVNRADCLQALNNLMDTDGFRDGWAVSRANVECMLKAMPSAQPEIIRCKDCKNSEHWYKDRRRCFLWSEDGVSVWDNGYCNYAERRTDEQNI